jgi:hypothetical protein
MKNLPKSFSHLKTYLVIPGNFFRYFELNSCYPRNPVLWHPWDALPNEVRRDAVSNKVRDASLALGKTG